MDRRDRRLALVVGALLVLPYVAAVVRGYAAGWLPSGDAGLMGLYARDVLHGHPPLIGTPTTAGLRTGVSPHHPGPIEFYAMALPMWALGSTYGILCWTAFANAASVVVAAWAAFRRGGPAIGLWAAFLVGALAWAQGPAALIDPINSDAGAIPLAALALLAWAVASGDRRLIPLLALWSAYYSQLHLGYLPMGVALTAWALGWVALRLIRTWVRDRRTQTRQAPGRYAATPANRRAELPAEAPHPHPGALGGVLAAGSTEDTGAEAAEVSVAQPTPVGGRTWPWLLGGLAVAVVAWLPVIIDAVKGDPSNLRLMWSYARLGDRPTVGAESGLDQTIHALDLRALVLQRDVTSWDLLRGASTLDAVLAAIAVAVLLVVAVRWRRRDRAVSMLALTALALAAIGLYVGAQVPSDQLSRLGFFRWTFVLSALGAIAVGAAVIDVARAIRFPRRALFAKAARTMGISLLALITLGAVFVAGPKSGREDDAFKIEQEILDAVIPAVQDKHNVHVVPYGLLASRSLTMPLILELEARGHHVTVADYEADNYGDYRRASTATPDVVIILGGSLGPGHPLLGQMLVRTTMNPDERAARLELAEQARSAPVVVNQSKPQPSAPDGVPASFAAWLAYIGTDPDARFDNDAALLLLRDGYFLAPELDRRRLQQLIDHHQRSLWGQDTVQVTMVSPDDYEAVNGPIR